MWGKMILVLIVFASAQPVLACEVCGQSDHVPVPEIEEVPPESKPVNPNLIEHCGPDYNFARAHQYKVVTMIYDLHCPREGQAIWIWDADGMVLDCDGHTISGTEMPVLRISKTQNLTLINCNLQPDPGFPAIVYQDNSTEADVTIIEEGNPEDYLRQAPHGSFVPDPAIPHPLTVVTVNTTYLPEPVETEAAPAAPTQTQPEGESHPTTGAEESEEEESKNTEASDKPSFPWTILIAVIVIFVIINIARKTKGNK